MKLRDSFSLAINYLKTGFRRHIFLLAILAFSFAVIISVTSLISGMTKNIQLAAENHYGGHLFLLGVGARKHLVPEPQKIINALTEAGIPFKKISLRTQDYADGIIHFGGKAVKQKYVFGIDWENERESFINLSFLTLNQNEHLPEDGIIISSSVAKELKVRLNDDVTLEVNTLTGQKNTAQLVVWGIIEDSSVFGYFKCYIDRRKANELLGFQKDQCSWLGLYFADTSASFLLAMAKQCYNSLKDNFPLTSIVNTREELSKELRRSPKGLSLSVVTLTAYISQVADLLEALKYLSYFFYNLMILIALSSLIVTYRLILHERAKELGTLRAIGLNNLNIFLILIWENLFILAMAFLTGFLFSLGLNWILSLFSYSWIPGFEILLAKGKLQAALSIELLLGNLGIMLLAILPVLILICRKISRAPLTKLLAGEDL